MNLLRGQLTGKLPETGPQLPLIGAAPARGFAALSALAALAIFSTHSSQAVWDSASSRTPQSLEADFLPGSAQPATPDLLLTPDSSSRANALAAFSHAIVAEDGADSDTALADYQKALTLDPSYTELAVKVAFELTRRGDPSAGIQVLKDNIKASPKASLAYLYLSQLYAKNLNKPDLGLKYAQQALDLDPGNLASSIALYEILQTLRQPGKAATVLDRAVHSNSADPQYWLQLGDYYLKQSLTSPLPNMAGSIAIICHRALPLAHSDPAILAHIATLYATIHQEKEAIPLFLDALKYSPANAPDGDQTLGAIRASLAICFDAVGRTTDAIDTLKQLIKDNPLRYESYGALCDLYEKKGDFDAALATCQQMALIDPSDFRVILQVAGLQLKQNKTGDAIKTLSDARAKFPTEARITTFLGYAYSEEKRYKEALATFEEAIQEAGDGQTELLDSQFFFTYGAAAEQSGDIDKAIAQLKKSIDLDPKNAEALNYLGFLWVDRNVKLDEAGALIKRALQIDPRNPAFIDSLGWYYFRKGDIRQALENLKKAAYGLNPEDPEVDEHLGDAYNASADIATALSYWQKAADLDKDNKALPPKIAAAREKLAHQGASSPSSSPSPAATP